MSNISDIIRAERWIPNLDIGNPVSREDIKGLTKWVMYAGFRTFHQYEKEYVAKWNLGKDHHGHDFISYLDEQHVEHFGLHPNTPVRAIADGVVKSIIRNDGRFTEYETYLIVQHNGIGLSSGYVHVVPIVNVGEKVRKGQVLATLYDTSVEAMSLPTHLHFELGNAKVQNNQYPFFNDLVDPLDILPGLRGMSVRPASPIPPHSR
jgi:murein DD-endopeptidase MepM/ murein hydrolase activator NlpD